MMMMMREKRCQCGREKGVAKGGVADWLLSLSTVVIFGIGIGLGIGAEGSLVSFGWFS